MEFVTKHRARIMLCAGLVLVGVFVSVAILRYKSQLPSEKNVIVEDSQTPTEEQKIQPVQQTRQITKTIRGGTVDVSYPFIATTFEGASVANTYFEKLFTARVAQFEKDVQETLANKDLPNELKEGTSSYYVSTDVIASTTRYISFYVLSDSYYVGMAHPSSRQDVFIFDSKNKKLISPRDLFASSSQYLTVLSQLTKEDFKVKNSQRKEDEPLIDVSEGNHGFDPTPENFSMMLPTPTGLVVYFSDYQIAPRVDGEQRSVVPYVALKKVINPYGVLGEFAQ